MPPPPALHAPYDVSVTVNWTSGVFRVSLTTLQGGYFDHMIRSRKRSFQAARESPDTQLTQFHDASIKTATPMDQRAGGSQRTACILRGASTLSTRRADTFNGGADLKSVLSASCGDYAYYSTVGGCKSGGHDFDRSGCKNDGLR